MLKKIIIDSDAKNEIDDQYAITYAVLSGAFEIRGFTATHFGKKGSMEESYAEIKHVLNLINKDTAYPVFKGADRAISKKNVPVDSPAARFIIKEALSCSGKPLCILSIGAITNLASAYLIEPGIKDKVKAMWLAGKAWPQGGLFFNNRNDILAAQTVFDSGIDLTLIPACGTANKLKVYIGDRRSIKGKGEIGDYLWKLFMRRFGIPKSIYDVAAVAAMKSPEYCIWKTSPRPALMKNGKYDHTKTKGTLRVVTTIRAGSIRKDFFDTISNKA